MIRRNGLRESLEAFAKRAGVSVAEARPYWRAGAVRALATKPVTLDQCLAAIASASNKICRVCPGFEVITRDPQWDEAHP
jgi:hypothetical protein